MTAAAERGPLLGQLLRYALVGLGSNLLLYGAYLLLTRLGMGPKLAMSLLYLVGVLQTFVFNKTWTFRHAGGAITPMLRYATAYFSGYLLNLLALHVLVDQVGWPHTLVQAGMIVSVAAYLFVLQRYWVFRGANVPSPR